MNYLWEVMINARKQGMAEKNIKFRMAEHFSAYMEASYPCLNETGLMEGAEIEVNPYYRFYEIFKGLYQPDMVDYPQMRKSLTNLVLHMLAGNDVLSGMTKEAYYKMLLSMDFANNRFGPSAMGLFDRDEREIILSGLLRQYQTGSSLDLFEDMMKELIPDNIVYCNNNDFHEIMVYVGQKQDKVIAAKMDFLTEMFVELPYRVEIYYEHHFGIVGVDETMQLGEIAIC